MNRETPVARDLREAKGGGTSRQREWFAVFRGQVNWDSSRPLDLVKRSLTVCSGHFSRGLGAKPVEPDEGRVRGTTRKCGRQTPLTRNLVRLGGAEAGWSRGIEEGFLFCFGWLTLSRFKC